MNASRQTLTNRASGKRPAGALRRGYGMRIRAVSSGFTGHSAT
jgi:hypothetical protein